MKKYFSLASALMLALGMGMTSCSNDLDEVQAPAEQQAEEQIVYLSATAPDAKTRAVVVGSDDSDAIKITGWKQGDVLKAFWTKGPYDNGLIEFTFDESIHKFVGTLPTGVSQSDVKFVTQGFSSMYDAYWEENPEDENNIELRLSAEGLSVDVDGHFSNLPLYGFASFSDDELTADMTLPDGYSLVCIHNNSAATITVKMKDAYWGNGYYDPLWLAADFTCDEAPLSEAYWEWIPKLNTTSRLDRAKSQSIDAGKKAYFPMYNGTEIWVNDTKFKEALDTSFKSGKVYKVIYE